MNSWLMRVIEESDSRYLTREEQKKILAYTSTLPQRLQAANVVEQKEEAIVRATIDQMRRRYPRFEKLHGNAWDKAFRDIQLVVRYTAQAMVCDDPSLLTDKALYWLKTILASFGFTPQFNRDTYTFLRDNMRQQLPADVFALLEPCLSVTIEVLSDFPEPAVAAV